MKKPHPLEIFIGMELYCTPIAGIGGKLKRRYEDFVVEEIDQYQTVVEADIPLDAPCILSSEAIQGVRKKARNVHMRMQKMGLSTLDATSLLSASLKISRHMVTYAGLKDKRALTCQRVSIPITALDALRGLEFSRVWLRDLCYARNALNIGDLWGNRFTILVRDLDLSYDRAVEAINEMQGARLLNYFGIQRFGVSRPFTHLVGRAAILGNYEEAIKLILTESSKYEPKHIGEIREKFKDGKITKELVDQLPNDLRYERVVARSLINHPRDYELAFSKIPPRIQTLFVHAYQSYLFNRTISQRFKSGMSISEPEIGDFIIRLDRAHTGRDDWLFVSEHSHEERCELVRRGEYGLAATIPGYSSKMNNSKQSEQLLKILAEDGVSLADFRNTHSQCLDSPGGLHLVSVKPIGLSSRILEEGLEVRFTLQKGSYATVVLREIMKNSPLNRA
jgi:tRNA pseudouridine13 synthase